MLFPNRLYCTTRQKEMSCVLPINYIFYRNRFSFFPGEIQNKIQKSVGFKLRQLVQVYTNQTCIFMTLYYCTVQAGLWWIHF